MDVLRLPGYAVEDATQTGDAYVISATRTDHSLSCPYCGGLQLQRFGCKRQTFSDIPQQGKKVTVLIDRQRYRCKVCGRTHSIHLPHIDEKRFSTTRLVDFIAAQAASRAYTRLAQETGLSEKTVRNIFRDSADGSRGQNVVAPEWIGIEGLKFLNRMRCVVLDVREQRILDILAEPQGSGLTASLERLQQRDRVTTVTVYPSRPYKDAAQHALPNARIVVDNVHVIQMIELAVDVVRRSVRRASNAASRRFLSYDRILLCRRKCELNAAQLAQLSRWTAEFPSLSAAYELKEWFLSLCENSSGPAQAIMEYEKWVAAIPDSLSFAFDPIITTIAAWQREVFGYFEIPVRHTYAHCLTVAKADLANVSRSRSFVAARASVLGSSSRR